MVRHRAAIVGPKAYRALLRSIVSYEGSRETLAALELLALTFVRPGELRSAEWSEFDLDAALWSIPEKKMKMRRPHRVPLAPRAVAILLDLNAITGRRRFLFPSVRSTTRCMSENTINAALRRLGFRQDEMTAHGFRSAASSILNESGLWNSDAIERQLAHVYHDSVRRAYARADFWDERVRMMSWWAEPLWLESPTLALLSEGLRQRLEEYVNRKEVQGPWRLLRHATFPIEDYLLQLFRTERLTAHANLPDDPVALLLTKADWGGLEIAVGGDRKRLSVWRIGHGPKIGGGDFENVRVEREVALREFPEEPPLAQSLSIPATDDEARAVIRQALADSGGFLSQENGAKIVRSKILTFGKKRAMQLVKELTGTAKPGPKGPRRNRAANRAE